MAQRARFGRATGGWATAAAIAVVFAVTTDPVAAQGFPGQVLGERKVTEGVGGFAGPLDSADVFGTALANIGDVNGDGVTDLAVGAWNRDSGCCSEGAAYVLFLNADGTVDDHAELSDDTPVLGATIDAFDNFGTSMAPLGDFDGNGVPDLVVGGKGDEGLAGGFSQGAVWLVLLETDGGVKGVTQIGDGLGGFTGLLDNNDMFGSSVANLGDLDGNGVVDLAVGAPRDDDGGSERGSVWILFLDADGTVASHAKISDTSGGFTGGLADGDWFGSSVAALGDLDDDGVTELAVGSPFDGPAGSVWILFLDDDGTVKSQSLITEGSGGFGGPLSNGDSFGWSLEAADLDGDRLVDLAVGAPGDDAGGLDPFGNRGAVWLLFLDDSGGVTSQRRISSTSPDFVGPLSDDDQFGDALAFLGDLDDDGVLDLAVGAHEDDTSGANEGAVWNLFGRDERHAGAGRLRQVDAGLGHHDHDGRRAAEHDGVPGRRLRRALGAVQGRRDGARPRTAEPGHRAADGRGRRLRPRRHLARRHPQRLHPVDADLGRGPGRAAGLRGDKRAFDADALTRRGVDQFRPELVRAVASVGAEGAPRTVCADALIDTPRGRGRGPVTRCGARDPSRGRGAAVPRPCRSPRARGPLRSRGPRAR
jgi:hypothetical protein